MDLLDYKFGILKERNVISFFHLSKVYNIVLIQDMDYLHELHSYTPQQNLHNNKSNQQVLFSRFMLANYHVCWRLIAVLSK